MSGVLKTVSLSETLHEQLPSCLIQTVLGYSRVHIVAKLQSKEWDGSTSLCIKNSTLFCRTQNSKQWFCPFDGSSFRNAKLQHQGWIIDFEEGEDTFCQTLQHLETPNCKLQLHATQWDAWRDEEEVKVTLKTGDTQRKNFTISNSSSKGFRTYVCDDRHVYSCPQQYPQTIQRHLPEGNTIDFPIPSALLPTDCDSFGWNRWTVLQDHIVIIEGNRIFTFSFSRSSWEESTLPSAPQKDGQHEFSKIVSDSTKCFVLVDKTLYQLNFLS